MSIITCHVLKRRFYDIITTLNAAEMSVLLKISQCILYHQVLAHLLDMVFYSDEKERVIPLLVNIMHYVVPYLRNHRWE